MLRPFTPTRCLVLLACVSALLLFTMVPRYDLLDVQPVHQVAPRDLIFGDSSGSASGSSASATSASQSSPTNESAPASLSSTSSSAQASATSAPPSDTSSQPQSTTSAPPSNTAANTTPPPTQTSTPSIILSSSASTNDEGEVVTVVVTQTPSGTSSSASASATSDESQGNTDDAPKSVGKSTIIGLSVAGGVAVLGIIAFIVWKMTRKRFADDFDDSEAIKWPELNAHGDSPHALPTNRTGGAGFETNSEVNLTRPDSRAGSTYASSAAASAVDLYAPNAGQDPYAVPPLPHLNPNQPYRDDPGAYYDPYNGPVPQTYGDTDSVAGGEAIPMTQIGRTRSPGPQMAYDAGRRSPGPQMAYDAGRRSPGPQAAFYGDQGQGRASPAPRAMSPGPAMALSGRASPGPQAAYGGQQAAYGYGGGAPQPPGLHQGY